MNKIVQDLSFWTPRPDGRIKGHRMTEPREVQESELDLKEEERLELKRVGFTW